MQEAKNFWNEKRVLVTGAKGFLGRHVVTELERSGCQDIFSFAKEDYDLVKMQDVVRLMDDSRPTIVIHLAAKVGGIGANAANPATFFYDNIMMGVQLLEVARQRGVEKFVTIGTVCSYPKFTSVPFKEVNLWDGYPEETNAPYGLAKKMMLVQSHAYNEQYGFKGIYLLQVNLYGPGDRFDLNTSHVIPALIKKSVAAVNNNEKEIVVWGDGTATREFMYVEDSARAIIMATQSYNKPDPVNLGSGTEISIKDLVDLIVKFTGYKGRVVWDKSKPNGQPRRVLDTSKAEKEFGFKSQVPLEEGIKKTIEWYVKEGVKQF